MSVKTYQRLETGKIALTLQQGLTLAQVLDAALEEFFPEIKPAVQMPVPPSSLLSEIDNLQNLLQAAREERKIMLRIIDRLTEEQGKGKED